MPKLTDIKARFDTARKAVGGINSYSFDVMSTVNEDKSKDYPAMLLKPPTGNFSAPDKSTKDWKIDFFLFDLWNENGETENRTIEDVWQALEDKGLAVITNIVTDTANGYGMVNPKAEPLITYGYPMGNDKTPGVRFQFTLRAFYSC